MGWWSCDPMGGDPPLDVLGKIENVTGVEDLYPLDQLEQSQVSALRAALNEDVTTRLLVEFAGDDAIAPQVLALVVMAVGGEMGWELREAAVKSAAEDAWAQENSERRAEMDKLIATISQYQGQPLTVAHRPLFAVVAAHTFGK